MSECAYQLVCPFYRRLIPIHEVMYQSHAAKYCHGNSEDCAILQVMKSSSFLKVPKDLYPNQTFRVAGILSSPGPLCQPQSLGAR
jgi:hypothetical protein